MIQKMNYFLFLMIGISLGLFLGLMVIIPKSHDIVIHKNIDRDLPPSLRVYYWINYYSDSLDVPLNYLYGIASSETSWDE